MPVAKSGDDAPGDHAKVAVLGISRKPTMLSPSLFHARAKNNGRVIPANDIKSNLPLRRDSDAGNDAKGLSDMYQMRASFPCFLNYYGGLFVPLARKRRKVQPFFTDPSDGPRIDSMILLIQMLHHREPSLFTIRRLEE